MFDYTIEDAQRILKSFDGSELGLDRHMLDNWFEREITFDYIFDCLKNKTLLSISKTMENRFKLIYPHEKIKTQDCISSLKLTTLKKSLLKQHIHLVKQGGNENMKENDAQELIYKYDCYSDILGVKVNRKFQYKETVEMDDGILLDFDVNDVPTSLEILDVSKRFNLPKNSLNKIMCLKIDISVDENYISINATIGVLVDNIQNEKIFESSASNYGHIPSYKTQLVLV